MMRRALRDVAFGERRDRPAGDVGCVVPPTSGVNTWFDSPNVPWHEAQLGFPHLLALGDRARTLRQALEVGAHVDVPGRDFGRRGRAPDCLERAGQRARRRPALPARRRKNMSAHHDTCTLVTSPDGATCHDWIALL